jgi:hypothetical protein
MFLQINTSKIKLVAYYRSSILDMLEGRETNYTFWPLKTFSELFKRLTTICTDCSRPADIQAIIRHSQGGPQSLHYIAWLDRETLLSAWVCGFMRPSGIERVDLDEPVCATVSDQIHS